MSKELFEHSARLAVTQALAGMSSSKSLISLKLCANIIFWALLGPTRPLKTIHFVARICQNELWTQYCISFIDFF